MLRKCLRGGEAGICAPSNTWFSQVADEDATDTESVGSVDADTEVPQAHSKVQAGPPTCIQANKGYEANIGVTCRKANAGFQISDCVEACETTPGAISQVWKHYANNIFPVVLLAAYAGKQVAGTRSATQGSSGGKFDHAKSSRATEPHVRPDRQ